MCLRCFATPRKNYGLMKRWTTFLLCWPLAATLHLARADAREYFVSAEGDDIHAGTKTAPWKTIEHVNQIDLEPGDRVSFRAGDTFNGRLLLTAEDSGGDQQQVVITSYGKGRATINARHDSGLLAENCNYLAVRDLVFHGSGRADGNDGSGVYLKYGHHLEVDDVEVSGFRGCGVSLDGVRNTRITKVYAHDNGHAGIAAGRDKAAISLDLYVGHCVAEDNPGDPENLTNHSGNGIVIGRVRNAVIEYSVARHNGWDMPRKGNGPVGIWTYNSENVTIQFCISHDNRSPGDDGGGFDIDGGCRRAILQYNLSYNNDGPGFFLCQYPGAPPLKDNVIRYNISQNDGRRTNRKAAIDIFAANTNASGCEIYHNTVYCETGAAVGFGGYPIPGVVFRNNIFVAGESPIVGDYSHARFEGNVWWTLGGQSFSVGKFNRFSAWAAATGQERSGDRVLGQFVDPRLSKVGTARISDPLLLSQLTAYRLQLGSPCLAAGIPIEHSGGRDFWGARVAEHQRPSIGACQDAIPDFDMSRQTSGGASPTAD